MVDELNNDISAGTGSDVAPELAPSSTTPDGTESAQATPPSPAVTPAESDTLEATDSPVAVDSSPAVVEPPPNPKEIVEAWFEAVFESAPPRTQLDFAEHTRQNLGHLIALLGG